MRNGARRDGFVLVLCMLLALALSLLTAGMLVIAGREALIASAVVDLAAVRTTAEAGARRAVAGWSTQRLRDLTNGASRILIQDHDVVVSVERLGREAFLIRSRAEAGPGRSVAASVGLLVRAADALPLASSARSAAVVERRATIAGGAISGRDACTDSLRPGLLALELEAGPTAVLEGDPPAISAQAAPLPALPFAQLADIVLEGGAAAPRPRVRDGQCALDEWNWGSRDPGHPCRSHRPLVFVSGDLTIDGGYGQGVLVVHGDLRLGPNTSFEGLILVSGTLRLDGGEVWGGVRAGDLDMVDGRVQYDSCRIRAALESHAFDRAFRWRNRWWIPVF